MPRHVERAERLYQLGRYEQAERELRVALAEEPDDSFALAMLALCFSMQGKHPEAHENAEHAVGMVPGWSFTHYAMGLVRYNDHTYHWRTNKLAALTPDRKRLKIAGESFREAIRLDPEDSMRG